MSWGPFFSRKKNVKTDGVFTKCPGCDATVRIKDVDDAQGVCMECGYHFPVGAQRRTEITLDEGTFKQLFGDLEPTDPLEFSGRRSYVERLAESQQKTGLHDAALAGTGKIAGREVVIVVTDSRFIMGSMGSVVGETITRAAELALARELPLIIFSGSGGGARMDEGMLSLMQMAKTSAAIGRLRQGGMLYISIITNPTYGGASASFASLGDLLIGEPKARMGFTGPPVIKETLKVELPKGFQEAEFMLKHGQLDAVVHRHEMCKFLAGVMDYCLGEVKPEPEQEGGTEAESEHEEKKVPVEESSDAPKAEGE